MAKMGIVVSSCAKFSHTVEILTIQPPPLASQESCFFGDDPLQAQLSRGYQRCDSGCFSFILHLGASHRFSLCCESHISSQAFKAWRGRGAGISSGLHHAVPVGSLPGCIPDLLLVCRDQQCCDLVVGSPPHPKPCDILLTGECFSLCPTLFSIRESECCLCLGIVMGCVDTLKNVSFFRLVPSGRSEQQREVSARAGPAFALGTCTLSKAESLNSSSSRGQE